MIFKELILVFILLLNKRLIRKLEMCMKILTTGAKGFIGKNLISELRNRTYTDIFEFDIEIRTFLCWIEVVLKQWL